MKASEIDNAVQYFREQHLGAVHRRINAVAPRLQDARMIGREMAALDARTATFRESLGLPDDEPDEPQESAEPVAVVPGVKA